MRTKQKISKTYLLLSKYKSSSIIYWYSDENIALDHKSHPKNLPHPSKNYYYYYSVESDKTETILPLTLKTMNPNYCVHIILLRWHLDIVIHPSFSICFDPFSTSKLLSNLACLIECFQHLVVYLLSDMKKRKNIKNIFFVVSFSITLNQAFHF